MQTLCAHLPCVSRVTNALGFRIARRIDWLPPHFYATAQSRMYNPAVHVFDRASQDRSQFATTRWSLVISARDEQAPAYRAALAELCQMYWYPLYVFTRRRRVDAESAVDLVQGFFAKLIE